ncbi:MAG: hypothetical protein FWF82_07625 [Oscillospiraceae bacterium]|nr:hypothetical protein [Oscillospiraceae bacterium]
MATETFFKRIVLSNDSAEKLAAGFDKPRKPYIPYFNMDDERRRGRDLLKRMSQSKKSSEQTTN